LKYKNNAFTPTNAKTGRFIGRNPKKERKTGNRDKTSTANPRKLSGERMNGERTALSDGKTSREGPSVPTAKQDSRMF
jgi:hypothetical protein